MKRFGILNVSLLLFLLWGGQETNAQQNKPFWTNGYFHDVDNSYIEVVSSTGWDENNARQNAIKELVNRRSIATGTDAKVSLLGKDIIVNGSHDLIVKSRVIDEYCERIQGGEYRVYLLAQTAKNPTYQLESVTITNKYPFSARVFVPGMAQIYKGSKVKGGVIIGMEALGVGGIVTSFCMKSSYENMMHQDKKHMADYANKADTWLNVGYGCIAFTAAVYVYNLIDGIVARGNDHIVVKKNHDFSCVPIIDRYGNACLAFQMKL